MKPAFVKSGHPHSDMAGLKPAPTLKQYPLPEIIATYSTGLLAALEKSQIRRRWLGASVQIGSNERITPLRESKHSSHIINGTPIMLKTATSRVLSSIRAGAIKPPNNKLYIIKASIEEKCKLFFCSVKNWDENRST
ncbi:MAG: hypothetical protein AB1442_07025 [Nitrospirota bacterium]